MPVGEHHTGFNNPEKIMKFVGRNKDRTNTGQNLTQPYSIMYDQFSSPPVC